MPPEARKLLTDVLDCATHIEGFARGRTLADLEKDLLLRSAIYYQFTIIGEALSQLRRIDASLFDRISESPRIVGFRNQILHGYQQIQDNITWQIIQDKLPILKRQVAQLLSA